jgi:hypothetical protein
MTDYDGPGSSNDATYKYGASGLRVQKTVGGSMTTKYYLDGLSLAAWTSRDERPGLPAALHEEGESHTLGLFPGSSSIWARVLGVIGSACACASWWRWKRARAASQAPWPDWTTSRSGSGRGPRCSSIQRR